MDVDTLNQPGVLGLIGAATAAFNVGHALLIRKPFNELRKQADKYTDMIGSLVKEVKGLSRDHGKQITRMMELVTDTTSAYGRMMDGSHNQLANLTSQVIDRLPR